MQHHISSFIRLSYRSIPNLLTLLNLVSGSIGVILVFQGRLVEGAFLVRVGALFDFLDGFVARGLRLYSPLGKQLDSLADLITFGFLPTVIMYTLLEQQSDVLWEPYVTLSIVVCSAFRLAKFNISTNQQDRFVGLSTTALGIFISTLPAIIAHHHFPIVTQVLTAPGTLVALSCIGAMLLVSNIPFMALKFHGYSWRRNRIRYICCGVAVTCMAVGGVEGIGCILLLYIVFGNLLQRCISNEKR